MSGRDAYFAYMRDFNEREGINSFYGRDKKRFLAGWHGVKDKDRPDKIREDMPEPPRLAPRPPSVPIPESLRVAAEKGREIVENQRMGDEDVNRAEKKPKKSDAGRRVYENEDLMRLIGEYRNKPNAVQVILPENARNEYGTDDYIDMLVKLAKRWSRNLKEHDPDYFPSFIRNMPYTEYNGNYNQYLVIEPNFKKREDKEMWMDNFINYESETPYEINPLRYLTKWGNDQEYYNFEGFGGDIKKFLLYLEKKKLLKLKYVYVNKIAKILKGIQSQQSQS